MSIYLVIYKRDRQIMGAFRSDISAERYINGKSGYIIEHVFLEH